MCNAQLFFSCFASFDSPYLYFDWHIFEKRETVMLTTNISFELDQVYTCIDRMFSAYSDSICSISTLISLKTL